MIRKFVILNRKVANYLETKFPSIFDGPKYVPELVTKIRDSIAEGDRVLEVGGADRPMLQRNEGFVYDGLDIKYEEACDSKYDSFVVQSVERPIDSKYHLIVSTTVLEHVRDNTTSVRNIYAALEQDGKSLHYVPSKWHPYSVCLRIVGPKIQKRLIPILRPGTEAVTGYPAFFDHCSAQAMKSLFVSVGFRDVQVTPHYRANDYFAFFLPFYLLVTLFENACRVLKLSWFASGFIIVGHKTATN